MAKKVRTVCVTVRMSPEMHRDISRLSKRLGFSRCQLIKLVMAERLYESNILATFKLN